MQLSDCVAVTCRLQIFAFALFSYELVRGCFWCSDANLVAILSSAWSMVSAWEDVGSGRSEVCWSCS